MMRVNQSSDDRLSWSGSLIILIGAVSQQGKSLYFNYILFCLTLCPKGVVQHKSAVFTKQLCEFQ